MKFEMYVSPERNSGVAAPRDIWTCRFYAPARYGFFAAAVSTKYLDKNNTPSQKSLLNWRNHLLNMCILDHFPKHVAAVGAQTMELFQTRSHSHRCVKDAPGL